MAEDEIVGWHRRHNGHEFEQTLGERRTEEPGVLQSMGSQRVGHSLVTERQQMRKEKDGGTEPASDEVTVMGGPVTVSYFYRRWSGTRGQKDTSLVEVHKVCLWTVGTTLWARPEQRGRPAAQTGGGRASRLQREGRPPAGLAAAAFHF